jgi:hypothetical protein
MVGRCLASLLKICALSPPVFAQEAAGAESEMLQYGTIAAAVLILILYLRHRGKRDGWK